MQLPVSPGARRLIRSGVHVREHQPQNLDTFYPIRCSPARNFEFVEPLQDPTEFHTPHAARQLIIVQPAKNHSRHIFYDVPRQQNIRTPFHITKSALIYDHSHDTTPKYSESSLSTHSYIPRTGKKKKKSGKKSGKFFLRCCHPRSQVLQDDQLYIIRCSPPWRNIATPERKNMEGTHGEKNDRKSLNNDKGTK